MVVTVTGPSPSDVAVALHAGVGLFIRRMRQAQPVTGELSLPEMSALSRLQQLGACNATTLARAEQVSPQAIGVTLAGLQAKGLVERRADPDDGRRAVLSLTASGRRSVSAKRHARTQQFTRALSDGFSADELATLLAAAPLVERLAERL